MAKNKMYDTTPKKSEKEKNRITISGKESLKQSKGRVEPMSGLGAYMTEKDRPRKKINPKALDLDEIYEDYGEDLPDDLEP